MFCEGRGGQQLLPSPRDRNAIIGEEEEQEEEEEEEEEEQESLEEQAELILEPLEEGLATGGDLVLLPLWPPLMSPSYVQIPRDPWGALQRTKYPPGSGHHGSNLFNMIK